MKDAVYESSVMKGSFLSASSFAFLCGVGGKPDMKDDGERENERERERERE